MRRLPVFLVFALALAAPLSAFALTIYRTPPDQDVDDLDHHYVYVWRLDDLVGANGSTQILPGHVVTGARLYFNGISNWNNDPNRLFAHLLDDARMLTTTGTPEFDSGGFDDRGRLYSAPGTTNYNRITWARDAVDSTSGSIYDEMPRGASGYSNAARALVDQNTLANANNPLGGNNPFAAVGTTGQYVLNGGTVGGVAGWIQGNRPNTDGNPATSSATHSFTTTAETFSYQFDAAEIADLNAWIILNGSEDIAIALDPDCHFFNGFIRFELDYGAPSAVPEPASLLLLGAGLTAGAARLRRRRV